MNPPIPGTVVFEGKSSKGLPVVIRYPENRDLDNLLMFINKLSKENTFIRFSGETIDRAQEIKYLDSVLTGMEKGNSVTLNCYVRGELAGGSSIERDTSGKSRSNHVGIFGISILKKFRGEGIGKLLMKHCLKEAKKQIKDLRIVKLIVYEQNSIAMNLYKKFGFAEYGRLPNGVLYKGTFYDEINMYLNVVQIIFPKKSDEKI